VTVSNFARTARLLAVAMLAASCGAEPPPDSTAAAVTMADPRPEIYADFVLTADLSHLSDNQRDMIKVLIEASDGASPN